MAQKFKWGVIGPGRIANRFADGLKVIDDAYLYAVASTNAERGTAFAAKYGAEKVFSSYEALTADPQVDAIYVATPHNFHFEHVRLCLEAGKPVLCEKPLTVTAAETRKLIEIAQQKQVFLMEALWTRYLPIFGVVRQWLDEGLIGALEYLTVSFGFRAERNENDRWLNPALAGGALLDIGIYPIAISHFVFQQNPVAFQAVGRLGSTGVDEFIALSLQYQSGAVAQVSASFLNSTSNDCWIYGSKGSIHIHPNFWQSARATLITENRELTFHRPLRSTGFEYEAEEAARCIREGRLESPNMSHADSLANMTLMDDIRAEIGVKYPFE